MHYEGKSKIASTLIELTAIFFNETKPTATKFEELEKKNNSNSNSLSKFYWLSSSAL